MEATGYYGGTVTDAVYGIAYSFAINIDDALERLDWRMVFLTRYARLTPEWIERQDEPTLERYYAITTKLLEAEHAPARDSNDEWL